MRDIAVLSGSSHPTLAAAICSRLDISPCKLSLGKFSNRETSVTIFESVRGQDVYIVQSGCGDVNDHLMELFILVCACRMASARKVTVVLPLFPYSRQPETPYKRNGLTLSRVTAAASMKLAEMMGPVSEPSAVMMTAPKSQQLNGQPASPDTKPEKSSESISTTDPKANESSETLEPQHGSISAAVTQKSEVVASDNAARSSSPQQKKDYPIEQMQNLSIEAECKATAPCCSTNGGSCGVSNTMQCPSPSGRSAMETPPVSYSPGSLRRSRPYKQWNAKPGTLVASMLSEAGAQHVITLDLHHPQYQGFFNVPADNLQAFPLVCKYITENIPDYASAVVVSPDAGGAKRVSAVANALGMGVALIHKDRRYQSTSITIVGNVENKACIIVDDLADTCQTLARAAYVLKKYGATKVHAIVTHGIFSEGSLERINKSPLDSLAVSNSVPQAANLQMCSKLRVFDVAPLIAEAVRRIHNGESVSFLFGRVPI